jgi:putative FmdB family regulatory protein
MPLYEYRCNDCTSVFEILRPMAERSVNALCPACESANSMPLISVTAASGREWSSGTSDAPISSSGGGCCGGGCGCG